MYKRQSGGSNEKIKSKEDPSTLSSQNKSNKNQENIQTIEIKTQKMHQRKLINTREELEMMKHGLINVFNLPMTDHAEMMNFMECRRTLKEILEGINKKPVDKSFNKSIFKWKIPRIIERTHNKTVCHQLRRSLKHWSTREVEMLNKKLMVTSMMEVRITSLIDEPPNKMMEAVMDTNEHMVLEELWYKVEETDITQTEIVLHLSLIHI